MNKYDYQIILSCPWEKTNQETSPKRKGNPALESEIWGRLKTIQMVLSAITKAANHAVATGSIRLLLDEQEKQWLDVGFQEKCINELQKMIHEGLND